MCFNLKNKKYCIENKEYGRDEYMKLKAGFITGRYSDTQVLFDKFLKERIKSIKICAYSRVSGLFGEYIVNSKIAQKMF